MLTKSKYAIFGLAIVVLSSCQTSRLVSQYTSSAPVHNIAFSIENVTVEDLRENTSRSDMRLPFVSVPNQYIKHIPALSGEHINAIHQEAARHFMGEGSPVFVRVSIEDAYKEFSAGWYNETERGFAAVSIVLENSDGTTAAWSAATAEFFVSSMDATHKRTEQVYQIALKKAVNHCLEQIQQKFSEADVEQAF